jgi:anti-anti-sigma factor
MSSPSPRQHLKVQPVGEATVVTVTRCPILDELHTDVIQKELFGLVDDIGSCQLFLNLTEVKQLISTTLGVLIALHKKLQALGGHLTVCGVNPQIDEVFEVTKMRRILDIRCDPPPQVS